MRLWFLASLLFTSSLTSSGQVAEFSGHGGISRLSNNNLGTSGGRQYSLDDGWRMGFRVTLNGATIFGHEFGYAYNRSNLLLSEESQGGMAIHQGFYNYLIYATREGSRVRPFATGGVHFSNFVPPGASAAQGQGSTKFGVNYGGGIKVRIGYKYAIRFDARQYMTGKPFDLPNASGMLRQNEFSLGFGLVL